MAHGKMAGPSNVPGIVRQTPPKTMISLTCRRHAPLDQHDPRRLCATLSSPSKAAPPQPPNDLPDCDPAPISLGEVLELEHRVLATPAAPNFEPPPPQVADRRARDRRGTVGQLRHGSPARRRHGPPDYVQAGRAQLIDQVLGAHAGKVEVSRPWQASAAHNRLSEHCGDLLVRQGFVCLGEEASLFHA